jgi:hypothetical protein
MLGLFSFFSGVKNSAEFTQLVGTPKHAQDNTALAKLVELRPMKSKPLHTRISEELSVATDPERKAELLARLAGHLARIGKFESATRVLSDLRKAYSDGRSGRVTVWILLAEGLVHLFLEDQLLALDKFKRVLLLGQAMRYRQVVAVASAWKAHLEFGRSDPSAMTQSLRLSFDSVEADDDDTHTRLAMVLFNSFTTCGDRTQGQKWFLRAHDRAVRNGDQASIEALLYNRATLGVAHLRAENCFAEVSSADVSYARSEMESVRNLQQLVLGVSLLNQRDLWFARLLILEGKYPDAVETLERVRTTSPFADNNFNQQLIDLEIAFCLSLSCQPKKREFGRSNDEENSFDKLDVDERLAAKWMQWKMVTRDSTLGDERREFQLLCEVREAYKEMQVVLAEAISEFAHREPNFLRP